jgi:hypothetical protein
MVFNPGEIRRSTYFFCFLGIGTKNWGDDSVNKSIFLYSGVENDLGYGLLGNIDNQS